jgi:hypothetical protein
MAFVDGTSPNSEPGDDAAICEPNGANPKSGVDPDKYAGTE